VLSRKYAINHFALGGFQGGGGNETRLNGTWDVALTKGEIIVVTSNYRLGVFGFLASDDLRTRDTAGGTGNYGILDQRAAMEWTHKNVAAFGGDPSRVFIVGQSAGANSVSNHMVRPLSWPYFSSAGMESGAFYDGPNTRTVAQQKDSYDKMLKKVGCYKARKADEQIKCLLVLDAIKLFEQSQGTGHWDPVVDGVDLVESGVKLAMAGKLAPVPVIAGYVAEDINVFGIKCKDKSQCSEDEFKAWAKNDLGFNATETEKLTSLYADEVALPGGDYSKWYWAQAHAGADYWGGCPARRMARWVTAAKPGDGAASGAGGNAAYFYRWTYAPKGPNGKYPSLAHHACEQPFVFHVLGESDEQSKEDGGKYHIHSTETAFSAAVVGYWASMAANGNPNSPHQNNADRTAHGENGASTVGPVWPAWTETQQMGLVVGGQGANITSMDMIAAPMLRSAKCDFWDAHLFDKALSAAAAERVKELAWYPGRD
jgi:carboxylesterase type B